MPNAEITILLNQWSAGDKSTETLLLEEIYPMIQKIARNQLYKDNRKSAYETLDLANEAFIKLQQQNKIQWKNRNQFLAVSTQIIRRILIDDYRARNSQKRSQGVQSQNNVTLDRISSLIVGEKDVEIDLIEFDKLLDKLEQLDAQAAQIVQYRFFAGMTQEEIVKVMNLELKQVVAEWKFARSWLLNQLTKK